MTASQWLGQQVFAEEDQGAIEGSLPPAGMLCPRAEAPAGATAQLLNSLPRFRTGGLLTLFLPKWDWALSRRRLGSFPFPSEEPAHSSH